MRIALVFLGVGAALVLLFVGPFLPKVMRDFRTSFGSAYDKGRERAANGRDRRHVPPSSERYSPEVKRAIENVRRASNAGRES